MTQHWDHKPSLTVPRVIPGGGGLDINTLLDGDITWRLEGGDDITWQAEEGDDNDPDITWQVEGGEDIAPATDLNIK